MFLVLLGLNNISTTLWKFHGVFWSYSLHFPHLLSDPLSPPYPTQLYVLVKKSHGVQFVLPKHCWVGSTQKSGQATRNHTLEENWLSVSQRQPLPIALS